MSLTINAPLTTKDGGSVASGSYVEYDTYFPADSFQYNVTITMWRDQTAKDNNLANIRPVEIRQLYFETILSSEDFAALTLSAVNTSVKDYLETFVGVGNVSINPE